jgi:hypothetical protein
MSSPTRAMTTPTNSLPAQLEQIGLHVLAAGLDDFLARATRQRWSPRQIVSIFAARNIEPTFGSLPVRVRAGISHNEQDGERRKGSVCSPGG